MNLPLEPALALAVHDPESVQPQSAGVLDKIWDHLGNLLGKETVKIQGVGDPIGH